MISILSDLRMKIDDFNIVILHLGNKKINKMLRELEAHNLVYRSHQGLGKPNKIYVYDLLKADNDNWLPKQFKHRKGRTNEKEIL